jgi:hypothetical protein
MAGRSTRALDVTMEATYQFTFSEQHLLESFLRYRRTLWWRRPFYAAKGMLAVIILLLGLLSVAYGFIFGAGVFGAVLGVMFLAWPIDAFLLRRRFRKSPFHNGEYTYHLYDEGVHVVGRSEDIRLDWSLFTSARRFTDGLLLFQGPHLFTWLPDAFITSSSTTDESRELVRSRVMDYRDV